MFRQMRALLARLAGQGVPLNGEEPLHHTPSSVGATARAAGLAERAERRAAGPSVLTVADRPDSADLVLASAPALPTSQEELERAQKLLAAGKVTRAISVLEARVRDDPDAELVATLGDLRTIQRASKRLQRRPNDPRAHFEIGRALFSQEQGPQALGHLDTACHLRPGWLEAHLLRAYELHWEARWQEAEAAYTAVLALDPTHAVARRGRLAVRAYQPPDALIANESVNGSSSDNLH
jgi:tetratricopeptide (TPR) repeat protein